MELELDSENNRSWFARLYEKIGIVGCMSIGFTFLLVLFAFLSALFDKTAGMIAGLIVGTCATALFVLGIFAACRRVGIFSFIKSWSAKEIIINLSITVSLIAFFVIYMAFEDYVYFWDFGSYWTGTLELADILLESPIVAIGYTIVSINVMEYNVLISLITAVPLLMTGGSYFAYYLIALVLFYIPSCFILSFSVYNVLRQRSKIIMPFYLFYAATILVGVGIIPILNGYVDAFCLLTAAIAIAMAFKHRFLIRSKGDSVTFALMLVFTVIGRRYFLYFLIGLTAAVLLCGAIYFIAAGYKKQPIKIEFKNFVMNMLTVAGVCLLLLLTVFIGFTIISLFGNYAGAYAGYQDGDIVYNFNRMFTFFGWITCAFALVGLVFVIKKRIIFESLFMLVQLAVTSFMFFMIQSMGIQHYYIVLFPMTYFALAGINGVYCLFAMKDKRIMKAIGEIVLSLVMTFNFLCATVLGTTPVGAVVSSSYSLPKIRNDKAALGQLTDKLYSIVGGTDQKIYVLGSGDTFNFHIVRKLYMPYKTKIDNNLCDVPQVDLRDGFAVSFWSAGVVVTSSPCEYHLGEANQRVVSIPNNAIIGESPLNDNFEKGEEFALDNGIVATVWKKTVPFDEADREYLIDEFNKYYADYQSLFENRIRQCK